MISSRISSRVQKRSGFDKSHHNGITQTVGTITPVLVDEVIPNSKVFLRYALAGSLPPLATDTYMKCYYDVRAFFIPMRLLSGGFESFFSDYAYNAISAPLGNNQVTTIKDHLPYFEFDNTTDFTNIFGPQTLADYLGYKVDPVGLASIDHSFQISAMPFLCYHRVVNDWFRQPNVTREFFARPSSSVVLRGSEYYFLASSPYVGTNYNNCRIPVPSASDLSLALADGVSIFSTRQANYDYDYFTTALPSPQLGSAMSVNTSGNSFTIQSLRAMNSLQIFAEWNQLAGANLVDVVHARYGANLSRGVAQRSVYLGGARLDIGTKSVEFNGAGGTSSNPFGGVVGATAGRAYVQGTDIIIDDFVAEEPGYIMVVGTLIPKVTYGSGIRKYLTHYVAQGSITDMANPLLQNVGNQPIMDWELTSSLGDSSYDSNVFGYTDRYAEFMDYPDECHGLFCYGSSLDSFITQRFFYVSDQPQITSGFLMIDKNDLNNITAVVGQLSQYGFYGQFAFEYKVSQPLAQYSMPSLQNPAYEHGHEVTIHRGGFRF